MYSRPAALTNLAVIFSLALAVPLVILVARGFGAVAPAWSHIAATTLPALTVNTLLLGGMVAVGVLLLGTATAWVTATCDFWGRRTFQWLLLLPLAMPAYVMAYATTDYLQYAGPLQTWLREAFGWSSRGDYWFPEIRSLGGAATVLSFVLYPYVYLLGRAAFAEQSHHLVEAGRTFGYRNWALFWRVSLPLGRPALIAGTALALMETLADYGTVSYFGVPTFTTGIFNAWFAQGDAASAARMSLMLLAVIVVMVTLEKRSRGSAQYIGQRASPRASMRLRGAKALAAWCICALPIFVGFVVPVALLLRLMLGAGDGEVLGWQRFVSLASNSFSLAAITAVLALVIGLILAYALRYKANPVTRVAHRIVTMGYAIPGTVVAVAVMIPLMLLDHALSDWLSAISSRQWGLLLSGSVVGLIYAYLIRFCAISVQTIDAGFARIGTSIDDSARSLGASSRELVTRVHSPLLKRSLLTAALLVFVDVMKELPATLVMRPFNFDTLAVHVYVLAKDERLAEASFAAISIVLVGLIPVIVAARAITHEAATTDKSE